MKTQNERGSTAEETTMQAIRIHAYGGSDVLVNETIPRPTVAPDEVLIRVHAVAVNPLDWLVREGYLKDVLGHTLPLVPGWELSGVVAATGDTISGFQVGDAVYTRPDFSRDGGYAEYVAVKAAEIALKPTSLDHVQAAAIPLVGLTAWQALFDTAHLSAGQTVLIHGAAGGVGTVAVQLAKWKGARVIGTASAANAGFLHDLGVDDVVDYTTARFEDVAHDVDMVLDTRGGETQERSWQVLKPGGWLVSVVSSPSAEAAEAAGVQAVYLADQADAATLAQLAALIDAGTLRPVIAAVFPLAEARQAHTLSQAGHARGKIILRVVEEQG